MPYISSEEVAAKRKALRVMLPEYKLSVTKEHHSGIIVAVMAGPDSLIDDEHGGYLQVNHYHIDRNHDGESARVFNLINEVCNAGMRSGHHDSDYGYVPGYYVNIHVGKWDRPYQVKPEMAAKRKA
jgi:hypothetical protein